MPQYRVQGFTRSTHRDAEHVFEAVDDAAAWSTDLPDTLISVSLQRQDGEEWTTLVLGDAEFKKALAGVISNLIVK